MSSRLQDSCQGVDQINKAVSQIEIVINSNAQTDEESSAASKALYAQTLNMDEVITRLKSFVDGVKDS